MSSFVAVAEFEMAPFAALLISRLAKLGFHPAPLAEASHIQLAGAERLFPVEVPSEERAAVLQFLRENGYGKDVVSEDARTHRHRR